MKNIKIATVLLLMISSFNTKAQEQGIIRGNLGVALGSKLAIQGDQKLLVTDPDTKEVTGKALNIGIEYFIKEGISISPSYSFFFKTIGYTFDPSIGSKRRSFKARILNLDVRYYFFNDIVQLYGIGGIAFFKSDNTQSGVSNGFTTVNKKGLNLGAGGVLPLDDSFSITAQFKYMTAAGGHSVTTFGIAYKLN